MTAEQAGIYVDAYREMRTMIDLAEHEGLKEVMPLFSQRAGHYHEKAMGLLAGEVFSLLPSMTYIEGENLSKLKAEDKEYLALGAADMIITYWVKRKRPEHGYILTLAFIRSFVRDFTRKAIIFGRASRRKSMATF